MEPRKAAKFPRALVTPNPKAKLFGVQVFIVV